MKQLLTVVLGMALCAHSLSQGACPTSAGDKHKVKQYVKLLHDNPLKFEKLDGHHAQFVDYYYQAILELYRDTYGELPEHQTRAIGTVEGRGSVMESYGSMMEKCKHSKK